MAGIIKTVNVGDIPVTFTANGATFVIFQQAFRIDGLSAFTNLSTEGNTEGETLELMQKFAYVMSGAYQRGETYIDWLSQFGFMDLPNALPEVLEIMTENVTGVVEDEQEKNAVVIDD